MVAVIVAAILAGVDKVIAPSALGGVVCPTPVAYSVITLPAWMGLPLLLLVPSELSARTWPCPEESAVKRAGDAAARLAVNGGEVWVPYCATIRTVEPLTPKGTTAETCEDQ